ncbi:MAG: hypothetical protein NTW86_32795 [Candidatus Sumerlaeota bacterium]|nr:hypothetical protein [Candidatus Sumerlaeota bacterium]
MGWRTARIARACAVLAGPSLALALSISHMAAAADTATTGEGGGREINAWTFEDLVGRVDAAAPRAAIDPEDDQLRAYRVSPQAIEARKQEVADAVRQIDPGEKESGKQSLRVAAARLQRDPSDQASLRAILRAAPYTGYNAHFTKLALAQIYGRFGASLPAPVLEALRAQAEAYDEYLGGGTENHIGMKRVAAMVFGEVFPEMKTATGLSGAELAREAVDWMRRYGREVYHSSMAEYLSPIYLGCHNEIWLTAYEYARTDEARLMSRAMLDWIWTDLAINSHLGQVLPPMPRDKLMIRLGPQMTYPNAHIQWLSWLYWGDERSRPGVEPLPPYMAEITPNRPIKGVFDDLAPGLQTAIVPSISKLIPNDVIRNIGAKRVPTPYRLLQSRADPAILLATAKKANAKTPADDAARRYTLRSVYVAQDYGIGAGYFVADPEKESLKHVTPNGIVYKSDDALNRIQVCHPYWYTAVKDEKTGKELGLDDWSGTSPFDQCLHWDNTVIHLFNIPENDPYSTAANAQDIYTTERRKTDGGSDADASQGAKKWASERTPQCIRAACVYVPASIDEKQQTAWGWLLRENDVYIAVRPFGAERTEWQTCDSLPQAGHERLALYGSLMGVVIEVGARGEYGSAEAFADKVGKAPLDLSKLAAEKEVSYVSSRGTPLRLRYASRGGFPDAWVDGAALDFANWPVCESPFVACRDGVLDVNDGKNGFTIDWSADDPAYAYYTLADGKKTVTGGEWLENGTIRKK